MKNRKAPRPQPDALVCGRQYCGTPLIEQHDHQLGRITWVCPVCERYRAGRCRDCEQPRAGRSPRCTTCRDARLRARDAETKRDRYRHEPEFRARRRQTFLNWKAKPGNAEHLEAYYARYRAAHRAERMTPEARAADRAYQFAWRRKSDKYPAIRARQRRKMREKRAAAATSIT